MKRQTQAFILCASLALGACTTMGTGTGSEAPGNAAVSFAWKSRDGGTTGAMTASFADGRTFSGPYLQITREARVDEFEPLWRGWRHGWSDWDGWGPFPAVGFATLYSGRAIANLQAADGERMRCRFYLNEPLSGMAGGGQGECQLANGCSVDAVFPRG